jgi:CRP-like cAMP-binding protein
MLCSHDVAYCAEEEINFKEKFATGLAPRTGSERLLLFVTIHEALVFCENALIMQLGRTNAGLRDHFAQKLGQHGENTTLSKVFEQILGAETTILKKLDGKRYHTEVAANAGDEIFPANANSDAFFVVLKGSVAVAIDQSDPRAKEKSQNDILSGAGLVRSGRFGSNSNLFDSALREKDNSTPMVLADIWPVGGIFGYVDFLLERTRHFRTVATRNGTIVAKITAADLQRMQREDAKLDGLVQRVLLQTSLLDLANCTCSE